MHDESLAERQQLVRTALVLKWPGQMLGRYAEDGTLWAEAIAKVAVQALDTERSK